MNPLHLAHLLPWLKDALEDWNPDPPEPGEVEACRADRCAADDLEHPDMPGEAPAVYPVVDLEDAASAVKYRNGKVKRTRYPVVNLARRKVVIALHQAGVERSEGRWEKSAHRVTCHRAIGPAGNRYRVHPLNRRLVATNRADRDPWHAICIEVLANLKGTPNGRHYKPETFGEGYLGEAQAVALQQEIEGIIDEVAEDYDAEVVGVLPHRLTGRNSNGRPNRQICCGFEIWRAGGEWAGAELGLRVPSDTFVLGGLPIEPKWHGPLRSKCVRFL